MTRTQYHPTWTFRRIFELTSCSIPLIERFSAEVALQFSVAVLISQTYYDNSCLNFLYVIRKRLCNIDVVDDIRQYILRFSLTRHHISFHILRNGGIFAELETVVRTVCGACLHRKLRVSVIQVHK